MCFFSPKQKFLPLFTRTETIHQERSQSTSALQHPHSYLRHKYRNLGCYADTPAPFPAHCTACPHSRVLNQVSAAGRSHPRTLPGGGAVAQGRASLPTGALLFALFLCKQYFGWKEHQLNGRIGFRAMLGGCSSVEGPHHLYYMPYRHSFAG